MFGTSGIRADRLVLAALCLMIGLSVWLRLNSPGHAAAKEGGTGQSATVDLGGGVVLPREAFGLRDMLIDGCATSIPVELVEPSPHGADASLAAPANAGDRVFYAYHGRILDGRYAATELTILHFVWRGASVLRLNGSAGRDTLAVKLTIPAGCELAPDVAVAALRREVQAGR